MGAAVAQRVEQVDQRSEGHRFKSRQGRAACRSVLERDTEPHIAVSEGPAMSWRLVQGAPCPSPETRLGLAPAATPCNPLERDKRLWTMT